MQRRSRTTIDMLHGPILSRILVFALPIFLGSVFQQLYNMVDSVVVGKFVGANALAAVGSTSTLAVLLVGITSGFASGASIVAAQLLGAGQEKRIKPTIFTTLVFMLAMSVVITAAGLILSRYMMHWINVPEEILGDTVDYFRIYIFGMTFMALYNFFAGFLRALGDSTTPLVFLIISSLLNIGGDLLFVIVLGMGVKGVAWATVIAQGISVVLCFLYVRRQGEYFDFSRREGPLFDRSLLRDILRMGLPSAFQGSIMGLGMVLVQSLINSFGSVSIAAYTAANKMESLCSLPMQGISMSLSLFVGQNIGAGDLKRCRKGLYASEAFIVGISIVFSGIVYLFGPRLMTIFVNEEETEVIEIGARFMRIWAPLIFTHGICQDMVAFLRGTGDSICSMISMIFDLIVRMIMAYFFALTCKLGFMGIAWSIPCGWVGCCIYSILRYLSGKWKDKAIKAV